MPSGRVSKERSDERSRPRQSFSVHVGPRPLSELLTLAAAASRSGTCLSFTDVRARPLEDLVRIAAVGGDAVSFGQDRRVAEEAEEPAPAPPGSLRRLLSRLSLV